MTLLERAGVATDDERTSQRQRIALERITRALYGPGRKDFDRVLEARRVVDELLPEFASVFPTNGNGKDEHR